jgi:hypothetical protein
MSDSVVITVDVERDGRLTTHEARVAVDDRMTAALLLRLFEPTKAVDLLNGRSRVESLERRMRAAEHERAPLRGETGLASLEDDSW